MLADKLMSVVPSSGSRALFAGGGSYSNVIDYIEISTPGNATDFGDLTVARAYFTGTDNGKSDRAIFGGGNDGSSYVNTIDYVTISSPGNATDFGDLWDGLYAPSGCSNGSNDRGVFSGGVGQPWDDGQNTIGYVTISTTSNTTDFGDLTFARYMMGGCSNGTSERGVFWGGAGHRGGDVDKETIDYITISSTGNATDFGDQVAVSASGATSNGTSDRGVNCGGDKSGDFNYIQYVTISSTGNAADLGDLTVASSWIDATSSGEGDVAVVGAMGAANSGIDYFTISTTGNASDFGDLTVGRNAIAAAGNGLS
jgi:hypothetical protein